MASGFFVFTTLAMLVVFAVDIIRKRRGIL
jgi:hypothetical protein